MSAVLAAANALAAVNDAGAGDAAQNNGDCSLIDVGCQLGNVAASAAQSAIQTFVNQFADAFATLIKTLMTFWVNVPTPNLDSAPVHHLNDLVYWVQGVVLVASILYVAAKMAITRNSGVAGIAGADLCRMIVFVGAGAVGLNLLAAAGDAWSTWIIDQSADGKLAISFLLTEGAHNGGLAAALQNLGLGLEFLIALFGSVSAIAQIFLLVARIGILTLLVGTLPLTAAASLTPAGKASFNKILGWIIAWILYKPAAAMVYAGALFLVGTGQDLLSILSGLLMMILAVFALPALMRLVVPMVAAATSGGGGALVAAGAGGALASGARSLADRSGSRGFGGGFGGGSGAGSGGGPGSAGPTHTPGLAPQGAGPDGGPSGGGAAGAPGPSGAGAAGTAGGQAGAAGAGAAGAEAGTAGAGVGGAAAGAGAAAAAGAATAGVGAIVIGGAMLAKGAHDVTKTAAMTISDDTTAGA